MNINQNFNEPEWIKLIFLLSDTQTWLDEISKQAFAQIPVTDKKKLLRKTYHLTVTAMAHIIERHYYKINRHPQAGKFHIQVTEILQYIRDASQLPESPVPGNLNHQRTLQTQNIIGYDKEGRPASAITIITDTGGKIITAFPAENAG